MQEVTLDENCYIMATLPSNIQRRCPNHRFYCTYRHQSRFYWCQRESASSQKLRRKRHCTQRKRTDCLKSLYFEDLLLYKGQTLITTDGTTLLGADDKAGITEIITAMEHLIQHPEIKHGKIRICFTPDDRSFT